MLNRLLVEGRFTDLVKKLPEIIDPKGGVYLLYAARELELLDEETYCAVILSLHDDEDDFIPDIVHEKQLQDICDIDLIKRVMKMAYKNKPDVSIEDIITALRYYIDHDAFMSFT